ncbi:MAG: hypothetical protein ACFB4I_06050 [Cyanophyceae cyanobacterium]
MAGEAMKAIAKRHPFILFKGQTFWFCLSMTLAVFYAYLGWQEGWGEYVVQDDARQHVFWMQRFLNPELFPNDLIADYFQSVAPAGYTWLYKIAAAMGIPPLLFNKLMPTVLGVLTTAYCFGVSMQILPVPVTGFMAAVMLNQSLWLEDSLASGTPRGFAYPLLLAFMYYLLRGALLPCLGAIALQGLFYPQCVFLSAGVLCLQLLRGKRWIGVAGLGVAIVVLLPYALGTSEYGPTISVAEAQALPEFNRGGRSGFFTNDFWDFWLTNGRSSIFGSTTLMPATLCAGFLLPVLLLWRLPLRRQVSERVSLLGQLTLVSLGLFFVAHAVLFRLHLPSRYTQRSLKIVLALAAAIAFTLLLDTVFRWAQHPQRFRLAKQAVAILLAAAVGTAVVLYPYFLGDLFPKTRNETATATELYQFLAQQPTDSLIASTSREADFLPTFARRSVLVSREYAIPYHVGYYRQFRQRATDLITAQYSPNLETVQRFIQQYEVDFWLLEDNTFTLSYLNEGENKWLKQYQLATAEAVDSLTQGEAPALAKLVETCAVFETQNFTVLAADCIVGEGTTLSESLKP